MPLTAVANYARVARNAPSVAAASEAADRVIAQVDRAAEVVRRLRNFIRLGRGDTGPAQVRDLVDAAVSYCRAELDRQGVEVQVRIARDLPAVSVDAVQIGPGQDVCGRLGVVLRHAPGQEDGFELCAVRLIGCGHAGLPPIKIQYGIRRVG